MLSLNTARRANPIVDGGRAERRPRYSAIDEFSAGNRQAKRAASHRRSRRTQRFGPLFVTFAKGINAQPGELLLIPNAASGMRFQRELINGDRNRGRRFALPPSTALALRTGTQKAAKLRVLACPSETNKTHFNEPSKSVILLRMMFGSFPRLILMALLALLRSSPSARTHRRISRVQPT